MQKQAPLDSIVEVGHVLHEVKVVRTQLAQENGNSSLLKLQIIIHILN